MVTERAFVQGEVHVLEMLVGERSHVHFCMACTHTEGEGGVAGWPTYVLCQGACGEPGAT